MSPFHIHSQAGQGCHKYEDTNKAPSEGMAVISVAEECLRVWGLYSVEALAWHDLLTSVRVGNQVKR